MSSSTSRDQLLRSVMTTKSAVVDRLSSRLGQFVNVVSGHLPEHHVQQGDGRTQYEGQDGVRRYLEWRSGVAVADGGSASSDADLLEETVSLEAERATFPSGKRWKRSEPLFHLENVVGSGASHLSTWKTSQIVCGRDVYVNHAKESSAWKTRAAGQES